MKTRKGKIMLVLAAAIAVIAALGIVVHSSRTQAERYISEKEANKYKLEDTTVPEATPTPAPTAIPGPDKVDVMIQRGIALDRMSEEDADALCSLVKQANRTIESNAIYDRFFQRLADPDDLLWNCFDQTGEVQIGWFYDGKISKPDVMKEENLTEDEFCEKYGEKIVTNNDHDAEDFAQMLEQCRDTVVNEALRSDLQYVIDEVRLAAETHDVTHVEKMYHVLHDMDYFLLNYRLDTEGQYIRDKSTISKYYGVLAVYGEQHE